MGRTLAGVRAANPPADPDDYARKYATAALAFDLARMAYQMRKQAGLTQRDLAKRMGTTQSAIARLEGGDVVPKLDLLDRLSRATGVELRLNSGAGDVELGRPVDKVA